MKTVYRSFVLVAVIMMAGCDGKERELEMKNAQLVSDRDSLRVVIKTREQYFDDVVAAINQVYVKLEGARAGEEEIRRQTGEGEGDVMLSSVESRQHLFDQIKTIDNAIAESRKEIANLEAKVRSMNGEFKGLNDMIANLKNLLGEREQQIAMLDEKVSGLEGQVAEKNHLIVQRDSVIDSKQTELNTVYYIVGTRSELEEMGVITDEGGFLWGLLGSVPMLTNGVDESKFKPLDKTRARHIPIDGEIDEIIPQRNEMYFTAEKVDEEKSNLQILDPAQFWKERYLVIVTG